MANADDLLSASVPIAQHRPLSRVVHGPKVPLGPLSGPGCDAPQRLAPPLATAGPALPPHAASASACPSAILMTVSAPILTVCPSSPTTSASACSSASAAGRLEQASSCSSWASRGTAPAPAELADSCYSSCSESEHSSLSRNTSSTSTSETFAQEYSTAGTLSSSEARRCCDYLESVDYAKLLEFALKLGFLERQLRHVVDKLGRFPPDQDRVLAELTNLAANSPANLTTLPDGCQPLIPTAVSVSSSATSNSGGCQAQASTSGVAYLRSVVIDGSNLAMTYDSILIFYIVYSLDCRLLQCCFVVDMGTRRCFHVSVFDAVSIFLRRGDTQT